MKLLSIDNFPASEKSNIDNLWSNEEKIRLGFEEADNIMTLDEFKSFCNELINDITNYKETIECLM